MIREGNIFIFGRREDPRGSGFLYDQHLGLVVNYDCVGAPHWVTIATLFASGQPRWFHVLNGRCPPALRPYRLPEYENEIALTYDDFVLVKMSV